MSLTALLYAYVLGGLTFIPLLICAAIAWTSYTSVPVVEPVTAKSLRNPLSSESLPDADSAQAPDTAIHDQPKPRKAWLTIRRTFEEKETDASYVNMMRNFLDSRSKDPKRSRPKDMWYVVLKGNVLYLYEDENMTECEAAIQVSAYETVIFPEGLQDGELFTKRNAICLKPKVSGSGVGLPSITREMKLETIDVDEKVEAMDASNSKKERERSKLEDLERARNEARAEAFDNSIPWFIFVRTCVEMEDWYLALIHAANYSTSPSTLEPVLPVFQPSDMNHLVLTLDEQPDVIPMRWLNALLGRIFFSFYRTQNLESFIIGRLMKKLSKVKAPSFLQNISVTEVSVGNKPPMLSKPMLKDLTKEGDAALEIRVLYRGEIRLTVEATAIINLGQRFKTYTVKLVLAVVLRKLDGNLLVKVKRPPSNRIWYAFTQPPEMELDVEPVVSDRAIKWGMICSTIESRLKEVINESVVMPNMDDIAFFESLQYTHRGGIWADACRESLLGEQGKEILHTSTAKTDGSQPLSVETANEVATLSRTESMPEQPPNMGPVVSTTEDISKRRSWFSSLSRADSTLADDDNAENSDNNESPVDDRGRLFSTETGGRRATSVPASKTSPSTETVPVATSSQAESLSLTDSQDAISTHSRMRSLSSGANVQITEQDNSSHESLVSRSGGQSTSSFLSTLKSKADKQALSNTAKEAMRKWSANWNGFKRDHMSGPSTGSEEVPDGTPQGSTSSIFNFPTKTRNYADIRAAVTGRRNERVGTSGSSTQPIDIPKRKADAELDDNNNSGSFEQNSSSALTKDGDHSPSQQSSSSRGPSLLRKEAKTISPPKLSTETHSPEGAHSVATNSALPPDLPVQAPPIKTQPSQGAMMTIPGIHASHRGDIQSYGYIPPSQPTMTHEKARTPTIPPTIQSVYRLFKSPTTGASVFQQQQQQKQSRSENSDRSSPSVSPTVSTRVDRLASVDTQNSMETNSDVTTLHLTPPISPSNLTTGVKTPISRSEPPPLPPRLLPDPPPLPSREPKRSPRTSFSVPVADLAAATSASEVLKLIAEQDETKRKDMEATFNTANRSFINNNSNSRSSSNDDENNSYVPDSPRQTRPPRSKRISLGAKRITPSVVLTDEPESMSQDVINTHVEGEVPGGHASTMPTMQSDMQSSGSGLPDSGSRNSMEGMPVTSGSVSSASVYSRSSGDSGGDGSSGTSDTRPLHTTLPDTPKPLPPPLPPRRSSTVVS